MSDSSSDINHGDADQQAIVYADERPAIGLVVTADNEDAIARALLRTSQRSHEV